MIQFAWPLAQMIIGMLGGSLAHKGLSAAATRLIGKGLAERAGAGLAKSAIGAKIGKMAIDPRMPGWIGRRLSPESLGRGAVRAGEFVGQQAAFIGGMAGTSALLGGINDDRPDVTMAEMIASLPQGDKLQQDSWVGAYSEEESLRQALEALMSQRTQMARIY